MHSFPSSLLHTLLAAFHLPLKQLEPPLFISYSFHSKKQNSNQSYNIPIVFMEKLSIVKNGVVRLLPGFRFHPTDQELVLDYLKRKVFCFPLPALVIPEVDLYKSDPWDLPGNLEVERYFFSTREVKYPISKRSNRATASGFWKATGIDKKVISSRGNQVVGLKKTLVFYTGKPPHGIRTHWIMHEYRLAPQQSQGTTMRMEESWVLCRIFSKKRSSAKSHDEQEITLPQLKNTEAVLPFYDLMAKNRTTDLNVVPAVSSSSGSSGITQVSSSNQSREDHEETSSCNNLSNKWLP